MGQAGSRRAPGDGAKLRALKTSWLSLTGNLAITACLAKAAPPAVSIETTHPRDITDHAELTDFQVAPAQTTALTQWLKAQTAGSKTP